MGLGVVPKKVDPLIDLMDLDRLQEHFSRVRETIGRAVGAMPEHARFFEAQ
jgi:tryptophan halogenase